MGQVLWLSILCSDSYIARKYLCFSRKFLFSPFDVLHCIKFKVCFCHTFPFFQSPSHPGVCKKGALRRNFSQNSEEDTSASVSFLNKVAGLQFC